MFNTRLAQDRFEPGCLAVDKCNILVINLVMARRSAAVLMALARLPPNSGSLCVPQVAIAVRQARLLGEQKKFTVLRHRQQLWQQ